jgi:hypothetical protein
MLLVNFWFNPIIFYNLLFITKNLFLKNQS